MSVYEYLEKRFGRPTRLFASGVFIVQMVFYMSVVLYAPAVTLQAVTELSRWSSVISVGIVCTFYCTIGDLRREKNTSDTAVNRKNLSGVNLPLPETKSENLTKTNHRSAGGMKAVLWTDLFQSLLMFVSMLAVIAAGTSRIGGFSNVMHEIIEGGRLEFGK